MDRANSGGSDIYRSLMQHLDRPCTSHSQRSGGSGGEPAASGLPATGGSGAAAAPEAAARPPLPPGRQHQLRQAAAAGGVGSSPRAPGGGSTCAAPLPKQGSIMQVSSLSEALLQQAVEELCIADDSEDQQHQQQGRDQQQDQQQQQQQVSAEVSVSEQRQPRLAALQTVPAAAAAAMPAAVAGEPSCVARAPSPTDSVCEPELSKDASTPEEQQCTGHHDPFSFPTASPPGPAAEPAPESSPPFASWPSFKNLSSPDRGGCRADGVSGRWPVREGGQIAHVTEQVRLHG